CNNVTSCKRGIVNAIAEEGSTVDNVIIQNTPDAGLQISLPTSTGGSPLAANSGPYRNLTVQYSGCTVGCANAVGIRLLGGDCGQTVRGLDNITVIGGAIGIKSLGVSTRITGATISGATTGILIGDSVTVGTTCNSTPTTHNVIVENAF